MALVSKPRSSPIPVHLMIEGHYGIRIRDLMTTAPFCGPFAVVSSHQELHEPHEPTAAVLLRVCGCLIWALGCGSSVASSRWFLLVHYVSSNLVLLLLLVCNSPLYIQRTHIARMLCFARVPRSLSQHRAMRGYARNVTPFHIPLKTSYQLKFYSAMFMTSTLRLYFLEIIAAPIKALSFSNSYPAACLTAPLLRHYMPTLSLALSPSLSPFVLQGRQAPVYAALSDTAVRTVSSA